MSTAVGGGKGDEDRNGDNEIKSSVNPLVAALAGAVLLSSDPAMTAAAQGVAGGWAGVVDGGSGAPAMVMLSARGPVEEAGLKDLLGQVR